MSNALRAAAFCAAVFFPGVDALAADDALLRRGEYIFHAAGCEGCHTREKGGERLAGGRRLETPLGVFYSPNITPDRETGIGAWSDADFRRALRDGVGPDGGHYYPVFPYTSYTLLRDDDIRALKAYLFSLPAVKQKNKAHDLPWYLWPRRILWVWKALYFERGPFKARDDESASWNRGAYLVNAVAHCGECHTERNRFGAVKRDLFLAGTRDGPEGAVVPNITPDRKTGIGGWSKSDLSAYFETGMTPDGDFAGDLMADVIDRSLKYLSKEDRQAMAEYLKSLPPIEHQVRRAKKKPKKAKDDFGF